MSVKFLLYLIMTPLVLWSMDSLNINALLKKNHVTQARIFYFILAMCIIFLLTNFFYDVFASAKIIS